MITVPKVQTTDRNINQLQQNMSTALKPITSNVQAQGLIIKNQNIKTGSNTINTGLGRNLSGWTIVRQRSVASIYDNQDSNQNPSQTLVLVSDADVMIDIYVF